MPRSATDRRFGFRSAGLVRILLAADDEEVLTAMEALGFIPEEHEHEEVVIPTPPPTNSSAKLAEAESLLGELTLLQGAMNSIESNIHSTARRFSANRTRAEALADVATLDALDAIYDNENQQYEDFTQLLAFILNLFRQKALAIEEEIEEEGETTTII